MKTDSKHSRIDRDYAFTRVGFQVCDPQGHDIMEIAEREFYSVSKVAAELGLTIHQFKVLFERTVGLCPKEFFRNYRAVMARRMIAASVPLVEISEKLGFRRYTHFAAEIRSLYGISPRDLQKVVQPSESSADENNNIRRLGNPRHGITSCSMKRSVTRDVPYRSSRLS